MNKNKSHISKVAFVLTLLSIITQTTKANWDDDKVRLINLKGSWKFSIGEREEWVDPNYDDSSWESIFVPSSWEDQGFYGYNGFAFYRKEFTVSSEHQGKALFIKLGYIDDVDEVYVNGKKIGSTGSFPPHYQTAYNSRREYYLPENVIHFDKRNVIAVKIYDSQQEGGILDGDIGIYTSKYDMKLSINLQGEWKFKIGDELERSAENFNDANWDNIFVPAKWEDMGYRDYDGYAWYRKTFTFSLNTTNETNMVIVMGKIDDLDQVYLNGELIGSTGQFSDLEGRSLNTNGQHEAWRGYYVPVSKFKRGKNVIAVRVYDARGGGGIYEGPIGIVPQTKYIQYWNNIREYNR